MTYGRVPFATRDRAGDDATVSHSAELVRGDCRSEEGPLKRPSGTFSPRGEGPALPRAQITSPYRLATG
jgi:hypothetical protein